MNEAWNRNGTLPLHLLHRLLNGTADAAEAEHERQQQHKASGRVAATRRDATEHTWPRHEVLYEADVADPSSDGKAAAASAAAAAATPAVGAELDGLCEETLDDPGDCSAGGKGSFRLSAHANDMQSAIRECSGRCRACGRCRYISVSVDNRDCSWYSSCDLACGLLQAATGAKYTTVRVRVA